MVKPAIIEKECLRFVTNKWRTGRDITWDINGPRELTIGMGNITKALTNLVRKKVLESREVKNRNPIQREGQSREYRLRGES